MGLGEDLFNLVNGVRSGVQDVPSFAKNLLEFDAHGTLTDGRKLIGDAGDVLDSVGSLGVDLGRIPARYAGSVGKLADSPILSAAQLAIEGEKALTGSGDPEDGNGYGKSALKLDDAVQTLIAAEVNPDVWDGLASDAYGKTAKAHRKSVSNMSVADSAVGEVLAKEADQVSRTRQTLDTVSQGLYDYGLATSWMNLIPGLNLAKQAADAAAAAAALGTTNTTMLILSTNALQNALSLHDPIDQYQSISENANSGSGGECGTFVDPPQDQKDNLPTRLHAETRFKPPKPTEPPQYGPPATPYESPS